MDTDNQPRREALKIPENGESWDQFLQELDSQLSDAPDSEPKAMRQDKPAAAPVKKKKPVQRIVIPLIIVLILAAAGIGLMMCGILDAKIPDGITLGGIPLGGLTQKQALDRIEESLNGPLQTSGLVISFPGTQVTLTAEEISAQWDAERIARDALEASAPLSPAVYLQADRAAIQAVLDRYLESIGTEYAPSGFYLEGEIPMLDAANFDPDAKCPTLVLDQGCEGLYADTETGVALVWEALLSGEYQADLTGWVEEMQPVPLDLEALARDTCYQPTLAPTVTYGLAFDMEEAQALLEEGEQLVKLPLHYIAPDFLAADPGFTDVLGFAQTPHSDNEKRNVNLNLACAALNGIILQPGESISYNATLGERTKENGYQPAPAYSGTDLVDSLGGGICQVSSTLYLSSLFAELEVVNRVNHGFPASYMPIGLDATVSWGNPDLVLSNPYDQPIKIVAETIEGFVRVWILGTETRGYEVRVLFSSGGTYAKSVIRHYAPESGELLSESEPRFSGYLEEVTSVRGELTQGDIYRFGNVIPMDVVMPTQDTLASSLQHQEANQHG